MRPRNISSTFGEATVPSVNFRQLCTFSGPSVNIPWDRGTFYHLQSNFCAVYPSTFVNFPCVRGHSVNYLCVHTTFRQLPSTFRASAGPSVNFSYGSGTFCKIFMRPRDLHSTFFVSAQPSVNFRHLSMPLLDYTLTYINFPCF